MSGKQQKKLFKKDIKTKLYIPKTKKYLTII